MFIQITFGNMRSNTAFCSSGSCDMSVCLHRKVLIFFFSKETMFLCDVILFVLGFHLFKVVLPINDGKLLPGQRNFCHKS